MAPVLAERKGRIPKLGRFLLLRNEFRCDGRNRPSHFCFHRCVDKLGLASLRVGRIGVHWDSNLVDFEAKLCLRDRQSIGNGLETTSCHSSFVPWAFALFDDGRLLDAHFCLAIDFISDIYESGGEPALVARALDNHLIRLGCLSWRDSPASRSTLISGLGAMLLS